MFKNDVHRIFCGAASDPTVGITDPPPWELQTLPRELELDPTEGIMYKRIIKPHRGNLAESEDENNNPCKSTRCTSKRQDW